MNDLWFFRDFDRLSKEREAIAELQNQAQWLQASSWKLDDKGLVVEAIIQAHGYDYAVKMKYPTLFPDIPPEVYPQDNQEHWSTHQYLNGALCLEWRPDTWHPEITGAQVLESAYTLFQTENPRGTGERHVVPVQHELSTGQTLRGSYIRGYIAENGYLYLAELPHLSVGSVDCWVRWQSQSFTALLQGFQPDSGVSGWFDTSIPEVLSNTKKAGFFFKTAYRCESLNQIKSFHELKTLLEQQDNIFSSYIETNTDWLKYSAEGLFFVILIDIENQIHCYLKISADGEELSKVALLHSDASKLNPRIPAGFHNLSGKSIGIVGLGSVGSKIAISLARSGVEKFYLVDEDVFLPGNTCRNSLDWRNIGEHKAHAVAEVINCISANAKVDVEIFSLNGQESSLVLDRVLSRLSRCDLIIDATANPRVFNLLASVAKVSAKPLVWGEVFAGGIGGLVARSRPEQEPEPQAMKTVFYDFLSTKDVPLPRTPDEPYQLEDLSTAILEASDADVTIIAGHLTQLAIDTLLLKDPSLFPYSMYLVGLQREWIFKAPFHTIPIDTRNSLIQTDKDTVSIEVISEEIEFIKGLIEGKNNADLSS